MSDHNMRKGRTVGVRELKARAAGIMRQVREEHACYVVTHRGRPVGVLMPIGVPGTAQGSPHASSWDAFVTAGRRVAAAFRPRRSGVRALSSSRR